MIYPSLRFKANFCAAWPGKIRVISISHFRLRHKCWEPVKNFYQNHGFKFAEYNKVYERIDFLRKVEIFQAEPAARARIGMLGIDDSKRRPGKRIKSASLTWNEGIKEYIG